MTGKNEQLNLLYNCRKDENHNIYVKLTARILHLRIRPEIVFLDIYSLKLIHTGSGSKLLHTQHSIKIEHNIMDTQ